MVQSNRCRDRPVYAEDMKCKTEKRERGSKRQREGAIKSSLMPGGDYTLEENSTVSSLRINAAQAAKTYTHLKLLMCCYQIFML